MLITVTCFCCVCFFLNSPFVTKKKNVIHEKKNKTFDACNPKKTNTKMKFSVE